MRYALFAAGILLSSCVSHHAEEPELPPVPVIHETKEINLSDYSAPFGNAPDAADLETIFMALPDQLAGDMTPDIRKGFIKNCESAPDMFDRKNKYTTFYNDNPYNPYQASSIFVIKILPSTKYKYVVAIHLEKPCALKTPPSPSNTFFLAPEDSQWIDITDEVLPSQIPRDWCFQPLRSSNIIEVGPYEQHPEKYWTLGSKMHDLVWANDHLRVTKPLSSKFTF